MVTGVALVRDQVSKEVRAGRKIRVDLDPALAVAEVPVVGRPGLVRDGLGVDSLAFRELDELRGLGPEPLYQRVERGHDLLGRQLLRPVPRLQALGEVSVAGERRVELLVGRGEPLLGRRPDVDAVAAPDGVPPRDLPPGDELRDADEPFDLACEPTSSLRVLVPALHVR